ncbi:RDD family protein [Ferrovibrio xuzhouensis]|uniref:RDD family protein n=1 Tax=Ferrovibrio xuzhouensis TaxID=1576914 RepID=A0ABV7VIK8_9PROT
MSDQPPLPAERPPFIIPADPLADPQLFEGVVLRRALAYLLDLLVILAIIFLFKIAFVILTIVSFGLLTPLLILLGAAIPTAYHTLTIGGPASATLGMRLFGLEVRVWNGGKPGYLQALLQTVIFYMSVSLTAGLILLWALFNNRHRCLHDVLCGTVVIRRSRVGT